MDARVDKNKSVVIEFSCFSLLSNDIPDYKTLYNSIFNNELVVKIDGTEISSNNLGKLIDMYKDSASIAYNYYQVLTSEKSTVIEHEFAGLGTMSVRLFISDRMGL